jgi:hypothetical protein
MNKYLGDPSPRSARANRERLAKAEREAVMIEAAKKLQQSVSTWRAACGN